MRTSWFKSLAAAALVAFTFAFAPSAWASREATGVFVNGTEVGEGKSTAGWTYADGVLTLTDTRAYKITGGNTNGEVRIVVDNSSSGVTLENLTLIYTNGVNAITFTKKAYVGSWGVRLFLTGKNTIYGVSPANDTYEAICVDGGAYVSMEGDGVLCGGKDKGFRNYRGVWVRDGGEIIWRSGTLSSYAATIGQTGGGIAVEKGGTLTFYGGLITNCYCNVGGGAIGVREGAHIIMRDDVAIIDCHAGDGKMSDLIHNAGAEGNAVLRGGTFDVHPLEHSVNVSLRAGFLIRRDGVRYRVSRPYYHRPVYKEKRVKNGIDHWEVWEEHQDNYWERVTSGTGDLTWDDETYLVEGNVVRKGRIMCSGVVHLVLADGASFTLEGGFDVSTRTDRDKLTICAQDLGTGTLTIRGVADGNAGIGGNKDMPGGDIYIDGGNVNVYGGSGGAAIGGGANAACTRIVINGGRVFADSFDGGAAIGGGCEGVGTNIVINGGTTMAMARSMGCAAIGGGRDAAGRDITINDGSVRTLAYAENNFIGGGGKGASGDIRIAPEATLVFWFAYNHDLLKADYSISTIVLPREGVYSSHSLVGGAGPWKGPKTFALTNVVTHAATNITVGSGKVALENRDLEIPTPAAKNDPLNLVVTAPPANYVEPVYRTPGDPKSGIDHWVTNTAENVTFVQTTVGELTLRSGWYVVEGDITVTKRIGCAGDVHLILKDGATLTAGGTVVSENTYEGEVYSLTIYGQEEGTGKLLSYSHSEQQAGIGGYSCAVGNNITINGGNVTAIGGQYAAGIGGGCNEAGKNLVVNGGTVTAIGGRYAAGIGGGQYQNANGIVINGGTVTATGGNLAAGIGGGESGAGNDITVNGGTITAFGGAKGGTAIGGGYKGKGNNIRFNGGTIYPVVEEGEIFIGNSAAVKKPDESSVTINPGAILVFNLTDQAFPAAPGDITNSTIFVSDYPFSHKLISGLKQVSGLAKNFTVLCPATGDIAEIAVGGDTVPCGHRELALTADDEPTFELQVFAKAATFRVPVYKTPGDPKSGIDRWEEVTKQPREMTLLNLATNVVWQDGWYVVDHYLPYQDRIQCQGDVHLILKDGCSLAAEKGVNVSLAAAGVTNSLTIYGEGENSGLLKAVCDDWCSTFAAIGSENSDTSGNITINGGTVTAQGGAKGAGIGGGDGGTGRGIVVNGGMVTANGGGYGSGIGGGNRGEGRNIVLNGGYVKAAGGARGTAAIGGGGEAMGRDIFVNGGTVHVSIWRERVEDAVTPSLIGSGVGKPTKNIRIAEDVNLVYDLAYDPARTFKTKYDRPTIITCNNTGSRFAAMGAVPDSYGDWTGPQVFALANLDTHATAEAYVNGPAVVYSGKTCRVSYRPGPGSLLFSPSTDATGVFVNGKEIGVEYSEAEQKEMGWWYDRKSGIVHVTKLQRYTIEGINVDGEVRFEINENGVQLELKDLTLIHTSGVNAFDYQMGDSRSSVILTGTNIICADPPAGQTNAVFCLHNEARTRVDGGSGTLIGNGKENYCAMLVCDDGKISVGRGTILNFPMIGISLRHPRNGSFFGGVYDRHPIENSYKFVLEDHAGVYEEDGYFYVHLWWYEEPVYKTPGDPKSGIDRWEVKQLHTGEYSPVRGGMPGERIVWGKAGKSTWLVAMDNCNLSGGVTYVGDVHLLLVSNVTVRINGRGLNTKSPDDKLTIYSQGYAGYRPTGRLKITDLAYGYAGIGGAKGANGNNITINGGDIYAVTRAEKDKGSAATIGGGDGGAATNIVINGGYLTLSADVDSAVIGGSASNNCSGIVINGGTIVDAVPERSAGIGCGRGCKEVWPAGNRNLVINGGSINASVGDDTHKPSTTLYRIVDTNNIPNVGPLEIAGIGDYGVCDIFPKKLTDDLYQLTFHLPEPAGTYWVNGVCHAYGNGEATDAKPYSPEAAGPFATEAEARAYAATVYVARPNKDVEGVVSAVDYGTMFKFIFREGTNAGWYVEPALTDEVVEDVTEAIEDDVVTALLAASVTNDVPQTVLWTRAGLYYGIGGSTAVKDAGTVPTWLLGDGGLKTLEGAKPAAATDKAFYRIRVTPTAPSIP